MSIRNARTGRHEDDFINKYHVGTATVGDLMEHAEEILVETPEAFGQSVSDCVRGLLDVIQALSAGLDVQQGHKLDELQDELRGD